MNFGDRVGRISAAMFSVLTDCKLPLHLSLRLMASPTISIAPSLYLNHHANVCQTPKARASAYQNTWVHPRCAIFVGAVPTHTTSSSSTRRERDCAVWPRRRQAPNTPNHIEGLRPSARPQRAPLPFLPPVWVPDAKTDACMRCARPFGFVSLQCLYQCLCLSLCRHFRRLSGEVQIKIKRERERTKQDWVKAAREVHRKMGMMGEKEELGVEKRCGEDGIITFYITDPSSQSPSGKNPKAKPARACNECYEAAFPLLHSS
ncbi:hypothetical protein P692DRAFT_20881172 [Suillus brevipes Sb2]|nr:hypothetical protein P692DRAFT_20881172 [Suillus brevipes Sb2]